MPPPSGERAVVSQRRASACARSGPARACGGRLSDARSDGVGEGAGLAPSDCHRQVRYARLVSADGLACARTYVGQQGVWCGEVASVAG